MLCPWCFHCGADDDEYVFDAELYCGICAQQVPRDDAGWRQAFEAAEPGWLAFVEQSLNRIGASKSGLNAAMRAGLTDAVDAFVALRLDGAAARGRMSDEDWLRWFKYACT